MRKLSKYLVCAFLLVIFLFLVSGKIASDPSGPDNACALTMHADSNSTWLYAQEVYDSSKKKFTESGAPSSQMPPKNFIDEFIFAKMQKDGIPHADLCKDEEFIRRVTLDLTGRIPPPDDIRNFLQDENPDKRDALVDSLIGTPEFVDRWTMWFGDLLRNTIYPVTVRGRNSLYKYIKGFVEQNKPYNDVVTELITATGDNWTKGPVNFLLKAADAPDFEINEDMFDNLAAKTSEIFLGVPLLCVSCHDGRNHLEKINLWLLKRKREEFWRQAAFFTKIDLDFKEVGTDMEYRFNVKDNAEGEYSTEAEGGIRPQRHGTPPKPTYLPTGEKPSARKNLRKELARMISTDLQFAKATVNRLWAHFMVVGIVDPPNAFDLDRQDPKNPPPAPWTIQPSHPELLNALAKEFQDNGYNLQHIMGLICKSNAYQLSSGYDPSKWKPEYNRYYARKHVRFLTSEELHDAIVTATWIQPTYKVNGFKEPVNYAMKLPGPEEPSDKEESSYEAIEFLNAFGRGDRFFNDRNTKLNLVRPLALMHSAIIDQGVSASSEGLLAYLINSDVPEEQIVEELYLATLSRYPTPLERKIALSALNRDKTEGAEDLFWALVNKMDFIFNH